jgi:flagellar hook-basal body complex protein FliE
MTAIGTVSTIAAASTQATAASSPAALTNTRGGDFASAMAAGLHQVEARMAHADALVTAFATNDSIPVHQVTIALEQARLSVELALQVRTKLVDAFHEIMTMQL